MAFRFALAPVLRLRRSQERQRLLALEAAALAVAREQQKLSRLEQFLAEALRADAAALMALRRGVELHFASQQREHWERVRRELREEIARREDARREAAAAYRRALREREALDTLLAGQRRAYEMEQERRRQQQIDALFLLQRWHRRGG